MWYFMGNVNLPEEMKKQIKELKDSGIFGIISTDEFIRESVRKNLINYQKMAIIKKDYEKLDLNKEEG